MPNKLIVNCFGAPSAGKSVTAASFFSKLKKRHLDCLLVTEVAKDFVVEANEIALKNQHYVWSLQEYRLFCAHAHAQIVVTDSPLLLGLVYQTEATPAMQQVILEHHQQYDNFNVMIHLDPSRPYSMVGRVHSLTESLSINNQIVDILDNNGIPYLDYDEYSEDEIVDLIVASLE
jgi:hypothetical protein